MGCAKWSKFFVGMSFGPLFHLIYINWSTNNPDSNLKLFVDDTWLFAFL